MKWLRVTVKEGFPATPSLRAIRCSIGSAKSRLS